MSNADTPELNADSRKIAEILLPEVVVTSVSALFSDIEKAEDAHLERLRQSFASIRGDLRTELSKEFELRFQKSMELAKEEFNQQVQESLKESDEEFRQSRNQKNNVRAELIAKRAELDHLERETEAMLENPEVEISRVIRNSTLVAELRAYVRGLQYLAGGGREEEGGTHGE